MAKIYVAVLLLVVPAVLSGHFHHPGYPRFHYVQVVEPRPVVAVIQNGVYVNNEINAPQRVRGYLTPDGRFTTQPTVASYGTGAGPIRGSYAFGGVFYPGGSNDTPRNGPAPVAGILQGSTYTRNDNAVRPRAFGHMVNGRFYEGGINNVPANQPGPVIPGNFAAGGVFFPDPDIPKVASTVQNDAEFPVAGSTMLQGPLDSNSFLRFG